MAVVAAVVSPWWAANGDSLRQAAGDALASVSAADTTVYFRDVAPARTTDRVGHLIDPADAIAYLSSHGAAADVEVVWTDDPALNCGMTSPNGSAGGCYRAGEYDRTLFVFWTPDFPAADRELLLLHEYAHLVQHHETDAELARTVERAEPDSPFGQAIEEDATCRALAMHPRVERSMFQCTVVGWDADWLSRQAVALGG